MLSIDWISNIEIYTDEWKKHRLGKFTSSSIHNLMAEKPMSSGAVTYVDQKACEIVTGHTTETDDDEVENEHTAWGIMNEPLALKEFSSVKKIQFLVTQKMIYKPNTRFSSTPDGLWIIDSSVFKEGYYNVASVEVKCPNKFARYLSLYRCNTPYDLKKVEKKYFYQVIDQMDNCDASLGYFAAFHPMFPKGKNIKIIEFRKIDLWDDFRLLSERKRLAEQRLNEVIAEFRS